MFIIIVFSWPFQIAYFFLGKDYRPILLVSMVMVSVASYICGRFVFKDGFKNAGWHWGKPEYYLFVLLLALVLWLLPSVIERYFGFYQGGYDEGMGTVFYTFLSSAVLTIVPAFGEEFSWRGYLLPRLLQKYSLRKALLVHGLITWVWHLPFLLIMGAMTEGSFVINIALILSVSFIPAILHAVVFAYIWVRSVSIAWQLPIMFFLMKYETRLKAL